MSSPQNLFSNYPVLTAPASGEVMLVQQGEAIATRSYTFFVTVASINTNVIVALNGSIDGTNWSKVIANQTITANGTTHYNVANHPLQYVQPIFVSESGGTAATVLFSIGAG
jgi:hypothetical protein